MSTNPEPLAQSTLRETCVLVEYHGGFTNWKKRDATASKRISTEATNNEQSYVAHKNIFVGCDTVLASIKGVINEARGFHYAITLPAPKSWGGAALISNALVPTYRQTMTEFQVKLDTMKMHLKNEWDTMKQVAQQNLGAAYNDDDYGNLSEVLEGCYIEIDFRGIPSPSDVSKDPNLSFIRDSLDNQRTEAYDKAIEELWARLLESVKTAKENLSKLTSADGRFRTEWLDNMRSLLPALQKLNISNDPRFEEMATEASKLLRYDETTLKDDKGARRQLAEEADKLFRKLSNIYQTPKD